MKNLVSRFKCLWEFCVPADYMPHRSVINTKPQSLVHNTLWVLIRHQSFKLAVTKRKSRPYRKDGFYIQRKMCVCVLSHFSRVPTSCDSMGCNRPGTSVHGILQARVLDWIAISSSSGSSSPRDRTLLSCLAGGFFTSEPSGKSTKEDKQLQSQHRQSSWPVLLTFNIKI